MVTSLEKVVEVVDGKEGRSNTMDISTPIGLDIMSLLSHLTAVLGNVDDSNRYPFLCPAVLIVAFQP